MYEYGAEVEVVGEQYRWIGLAATSEAASDQGNPHDLA